MKSQILFPVILFFGYGIHAQTMWNVKAIDLLMLQRITPCYGLHIENKNLRLEFSTPYSKNADQSRYSESTSRPDKAIRFIHARLGLTALQTDPVTKNKDLSGYYKDKYLGNGWWTLKWENIHAIFDDNLIFEPGFDYYQYYATTKGDATIYGTNGQPIGSVVGTNMRVYSGYARLTFQRSGDGIARYFAEYLYALSLTMEDVKYGMITTGLKPGGNSGFDVRRGGFKLGVELFAKKIVSTRFVLGTSPGIKGRNAFSTYINLGIPLIFSR